MRAPGAKALYVSGQFWADLERHRGTHYYAGLRDKLVEFLRQKKESLSPVSGSDGPFSGDSALRGIWHYAIVRNPDIVVMYTIEGGNLSLAMLGSHHDYKNHGKNKSVEPRTAARVASALSSGNVRSPGWSRLAWAAPQDILDSPDLHELSPQAMDALLEGLHEEMETSARFKRAHGKPIEETDDAEFDRYMGLLDRCVDVVCEIRHRPRDAATLDVRAGFEGPPAPRPAR